MLLLILGCRGPTPTGEACTRADPGYGDRSAPAGPDGVYFTEDDTWRASGLAALGAR